MARRLWAKQGNLVVNYNHWLGQQRIDMPMWYRTIVAARSGVYVSELNLPINETLHAILEDLRSQGFKALVVGGAVRDAVMGVVPKDIDVEVYGADYDTLHTTLSKYDRADGHQGSLLRLGQALPCGDGASGHEHGSDLRAPRSSELCVMGEVWTLGLVALGRAPREDRFADRFGMTVVFVDVRCRGH